MIPTVENVLSVYRRASISEYREGIEWYLTAHKVALSLDPQNVFRAAGVIAALSPLNEWENNKNKAFQLYRQRGIVCVGPNGANGIGLGANVRKAQAIYFGADPLDILTSDKVRNFYLNIAYPEDSIGVTIDRHAFDIAIGRVTGDDARKALSRKGVYREFADTYRIAASVLHLPAPALQAITWVRWRNEKG